MLQVHSLEEERRSSPREGPWKETRRGPETTASGTRRKGRNESLTSGAGDREALAQNLERQTWRDRGTGESASVRVGSDTQPRRRRVGRWDAEATSKPSELREHRANVPPGKE